MRVTAKHVSEIIRNGNAIVKMISSPVEHTDHWDFLLKQFKNPKVNRPIKPLEAKAQREYILDLHDIKAGVKKRKVNALRGQPKNTNYIKKTAFSLLPADGRMNLFSPQHAIGLICDIQRNVHLKGEKYIFLKNGVTNEKWWILGQPGFNRVSQKDSATTILNLRKNNQLLRENGIVPDHNELLVSPSRESIVGVFTPYDNLTSRLSALFHKILVRKNLNLDLAIKIITTQNGERTYETKEQINDLIKAIQAGNIAGSFTNKILASKDLDLSTLKLFLTKAKELPLNKARSLLNRIFDEHHAYKLIIGITLAAELRCWNIVKYLLETTNSNSNELGAALWDAIDHDSDESKIIASSILEKHVNLSLVYQLYHHEKYSYAAIHLAIKKNNYAMVKALLQKNANINQSDEEKQCMQPLHLATMFGNTEMMKLLLQNGANSNLKYQGKTAFQIAIKYKQREAMKILNRHHIDLLQKHHQSLDACNQDAKSYHPHTQTAKQQKDIPNLFSKIKKFYSESEDLKNRNEMKVENRRDLVNFFATAADLNTTLRHLTVEQCHVVLQFIQTFFPQLMIATMTALRKVLLNLSTEKSHMVLQSIQERLPSLIASMDDLKMISSHKPQNFKKSVFISCNAVKYIIKALDTYSDRWKFSLFGHHHQARVEAVMQAISLNRNNFDAVKTIINNQYSLFHTEYGTQSCIGLLNSRWTSAESLRNKKQGGYSHVIDDLHHTFCI